MALPENKITLEDIKAVVDANPDRKNPGQNEEAGFAECKYFAGNGAPSCVFGHVFKAAGIRHDDIVKRNAEEILYFKELFDVSPSGLQLMQDEADQGATWSEAFELAAFGIEGE
jgi:hypothetical protein